MDLTVPQWLSGVNPGIMKYYLIERQSGGCDYTIGCGIRVTQLSAKNLEEAKEEASESIGYYWKGRDECSIQAAELLEVSESVDLSSFLDQKKVEREAKKRAADEVKQRQKDEEEFARLQRKLGK